MSIHWSTSATALYVDKLSPRISRLTVSMHLILSCHKANQSISCCSLPRTVGLTSIRWRCWYWKPWHETKNSGTDVNRVRIQIWCNYRWNSVRTWLCFANKERVWNRRCYNVISVQPTENVRWVTWYGWHLTMGSFYQRSVESVVWLEMRSASRWLSVNIRPITFSVPFIRRCHRLFQNT